MTEPQHPTSEAARHALPSGLIHDLRAPLNQVIGYSELLMEQAQEQGQDDFVQDLQKIQTAGKQLLALIDDNFHPIRALEMPAAAETMNEEVGEIHPSSFILHPSSFRPGFRRGAGILARRG